jgi:hypothetical protein
MHFIQFLALCTRILSKLSVHCRYSMCTFYRFIKKYFRKHENVVTRCAMLSVSFVTIVWRVLTFLMEDTASR